MKKDRALDIFDLLSAIDRKDRNYLNTKDDQSKKGFTPLVALRWMSSVQGSLAESYILLTNEFANIDFHDLIDHPDLQYRLLTVVGRGKPLKHQWIPIAKRGKAGTQLQDFVGQYFPLASYSEIDMLITSFTTETFNDFINQTGCSPEEAKDVKAAFKKNC